ncbi:ClpX C4-type zinc finger protein [Streptomyces griseiscabiei]|uniref:ClpX C4-type zinc finger protein n=1 Tax=Streptomyces griseiscabiei TaxID=2993540 RepID=A0ABU4LMB8_9ACTN|nr:ClpX C4-type zinc finger protein [Streptomyces griseiscabiei]MBP5866115.1 hypothetical protein [Streptomyces sp. LBUM 1484]MBZ3908858.1 hypothetical protein [Streptomyces griseiscabiei]MDX2916133.1 ClpX C4-type zinc finger protein [Streptomyces griseiscabiei]
MSAAQQDPEPYCWWCGTRQSQGEKDPRWVLCQGPGTTICSECIDLVTAIVEDERQKRAQEV